MIMAHTLPTHEPSLRVTALDARMRKAWEKLWQESVDNKLKQHVIDHSFHQITDAQSPLNALIACIDNEPVGLLHFVVHPVAGSVNPVCYMQDLFVAPAHRRAGIGRTLIESLAAIGRAENWDRIYWLAEDTNEKAGKLYANLGVKLDFNLYILPLAMLDALKESQ